MFIGDTIRDFPNSCSYYNDQESKACVSISEELMNTATKALEVLFHLLSFVTIDIEIAKRSAVRLKCLSLSLSLWKCKDYGHSEISCDNEMITTRVDYIPNVCVSVRFNNCREHFKFIFKNLSQICGLFSQFKWKYVWIRQLLFLSLNHPTIAVRYIVHWCVQIAKCYCNFFNNNTLYC